MPRSGDRGTFAGRATIAGRLLARGWGRRVKLQGKPVHAVTQAGRLRTIVKDVAEMAAAAAAMHLGAHHAKGAVLGLADGIFEWLIEARPAGTALELGFGREQ